jgi:deazaflavin-dependent oxidoreductase (nitroreductase family)
VADHVWPATRRFANAHAYLYRRSRGRFGRSLPGVPGTVLLLDHVGARSGAKRTTPVFYAEDGPDLILVASKGGYPKNPAWFHNLMANPDTTVQVGAEVRPVHARLAAPGARDRLWALAVRGYPGYETYRARTAREIPLVVLEPR